jgi:hypothetical protein
MRIALLTSFALCLGAAPAHAVVGGERVAPEDVPWFATVGSCGATLVAPDRLLTAGHCVEGRSAAELGRTSVGGEVRTIVGVAQHPRAALRNGDIPLDDVALVRIDPPVTNVAPVALAAKGEKRSARIVGSGRPFAPGTGHSEAELYSGGLRQATLKPVSGRACARAFAHNRPGTGERFDAARMVCGIDVDGRAPLSSGCFGDSGGPWIVDTTLVGVVSWGGDRCGADHSPSVFAGVAHYRSFITSPHPRWRT